jgi:hypothetical protein
MNLQEQIEEFREEMGLWNADFCNQAFFNPRLTIRIEDLL